MGSMAASLQPSGLWNPRKTLFTTCRSRLLKSRTRIVEARDEPGILGGGGCCGCGGGGPCCGCCCPPAPCCGPPPPPPPCCCGPPAGPPPPLPPYTKIGPVLHHLLIIESKSNGLFSFLRKKFHGRTSTEYIIRQRWA